jgi:hypothetical protein
MDAAELKATPATLIAAILDVRTLVTRRPSHELVLLEKSASLLQCRSGRLIPQKLPRPR